MFTLKPTHKPVAAYYAALARFHQHGHTTEGNTRSAFADLDSSALTWHNSTRRGCQMPMQESFFEQRMAECWIAVPENSDQERLELPCNIEAAQFECPDIECGAVFSYGRKSLGRFVLPAFCPTCGGSMDASGESDDTPLIIDMVAEYCSTEPPSRHRLAAP